MSYRLGILVSHPIQYYAPWFRYLADQVDLEVFYSHLQDAKGQADGGFGVEFEWDIPLLEGYSYRFLKNVSANPGVATFKGLDTPELFEIIRPNRFDGVLLFAWNRKNAWQAIRACRKSRTPVLMRGDSHLGTSRSKLTSLTKLLPYRAFLPRIDAHLYVGQRNKDYLKRYGVSDDRLFFSPHFVDGDSFRNGAERAGKDGTVDSLRRELEIPADAFVFLFVGKLTEVKRPFDLLNAFLKLNDANTHLVFVGDGPLRVQLASQCASLKRVHFAGFRNQKVLPGFYALANALVLPSTAETWGLVVNEALACGLPVIVSNTVGCVPDLVDESSVTGFKFEMGNVDALCEAMRKVKSVNHAEFAEAIQRRVQTYSMSEATRGLFQALDHVCGATAGANLPAEAVVARESQVETLNSLVIGLGAMAYGKERRAVRTFKSLQNVRPYFFTSKWEDGSVSQLLKENQLEFGIAPFGYLGRAKIGWTLVALAHLPILCFKIISAYLKQRCNVIVIISAGAFVNGLPAMLALRYLCRARLIFYLGDSPRVYWVNKLVARLIKMTSRQVITNSVSVKNGWVSVGVPEEIISVIYNGLDLEKFERAIPCDLHTRFDWPAESLIFGFAGQLRPNKGVQDFIDAAEIVLHETENCRFVLIGQAASWEDYARHFIGTIQERGLDKEIAVLGWVDEIESVYKAIDVRVVPSRHEDPAPNVNIEAMASGIPVVATRVGGNPELVLNEETGLLVDKERPKQIAASLLRLSNDAELRLRLGAAGQARARSMFDIRKTATQIEEVLLGY